MFKRLSILVGAVALAIQPATAQETAQPPIDPVRHDAAQTTVGYIFPPGTYSRVMEQMMGTAMDSVMASVGKMPMRDIAAISGRSPEELEKLGDGSLEEMLTILDPAYDERMKLTMQAMSGEMGALMSTFEPAFRDGLVRAYARRFTIRQLADLNRFFETPTGGLYAAESMVIMADPEVIKKMAEVMPEMMKQMPAMIASLKQATAHLPMPRKPSDLAKADKARLSELLGVPESELGK